MQTSELDLLEALQSGDETAFEMIFRTYYQSLCNYANAFLDDRDESEEVVQASLLSVWEKRSSIDITLSLKAYLYRSVRNASLNVIKHRKVRQQHAQHQTAFAVHSVESTTQSVLADELDKKIAEAMLTLPEQCRLVFKLSRFEDLKYSEIADQLNISIKTVENHMGKALKLMRQQLKDYLPLILVLMNGFLN